METVTDETTYWQPALDSSAIYQQLEDNKYHQLNRNSIKLA